MSRARLLRALSRSLIAFALAAPLAAEDLEGSADHPAAPRYKGAEILAQSSRDFDEYTMPLGSADKKMEKRLEGKVVKTLYQVPAGATPLAVSRSYQDALTAAGFKILYQCSTRQCTADRRDGGSLGYGGSYMRQLGGNSPGDDVTYLLTAHRAKDDVYVMVAAFGLYSYPDRVFNEAVVVEVKPLEAGLVEFKDAAAMTTDIGATGHSAVYGVYFDTGKAIVKPESDSTLVEIAKLLQANPTMKLHVVGHTDNTGTSATNMTLSKQRADAVVAALVGKHAIAASRLAAAGVGSLSPVTTNRTDEGRAKNRRVELVEQ
jgi:OOP family OmpA-OmpF porin